jgi:esterase
MKLSSPGWSIPAGLKWFEISGYPMSFRDEGAGDPLVLIHGSFCDYRYWNAQVGPFAERHRVIAASLRHYFPEIWDGKDADFTFEQHADDVAGLVRALGLEGVHLLGHSRGGAVAIEVAKRHPDIIRSLILSDASCKLDLVETEENRKADAFRADLFRELRATVEAGDAERGVERFLDRLMGPGAWASLPRPRQLEMLQNLWTALVEDQVPTTSDEDLRKFDFPIRIILGEKSPLHTRSGLPQCAPRRIFQNLLSFPVRVTR